MRSTPRSGRRSAISGERGTGPFDPAHFISRQARVVLQREPMLTERAIRSDPTFFKQTALHRSPNLDVHCYAFARNRLALDHRQQLVETAPPFVSVVMLVCAYKKAKHSKTPLVSSRAEPPDGPLHP